MLKTKSKEVGYSDKNFDEVIVNFVGIEAACIRCNVSFSLKLQLYKHLKAGCMKKPQAALFLLTHSPSPIPIIKS